MWSSTESSENAASGMVTARSETLYRVRIGECALACQLAGRLRRSLEARRPAQGAPSEGPTDVVALGDLVTVQDHGDGTGTITGVLPRRNHFSRPAAGRPRTEQVIAANLDQVVALLAAAQPTPKWRLLDRYLVASEYAGLPCLVVITKVDLLHDDRLQEAAAIYRRIGYVVLLTSVLTGVGVEALRQSLAGRLSVFLGKSGVGKTSLLNALETGLGRRVQAVSQATHKGRHTTSALAMFDLQGGGQVIDTPGMREFGVWGVAPEELALGFVEMRPYLGACRFGSDCLHASEPGCAVKAAVDAGGVSPQRYESYCRLLRGGPDDA